MYNIIPKNNEGLLVSLWGGIHPGFQVKYHNINSKHEWNCKFHFFKAKTEPVPQSNSPPYYVMLYIMKQV